LLLHRSGIHGACRPLVENGSLSLKASQKSEAERQCAGGRGAFDNLQHTRRASRYVVSAFGRKPVRTAEEIQQIADSVADIDVRLAVRLRALADRVSRWEDWADDLVDSARIAERVSVEHLRPRRR